MQFSSDELEILERTRPNKAHRWSTRSGYVEVFAVIDHGGSPALGELRVGPSDRNEALEMACRLARSASVRAGLLGLPHGGMATVTIDHPRLDHDAHVALLRKHLGGAEVRAVVGPGLERAGSELGEHVLGDEVLGTLRGDVLEACLAPLMKVEACTALVLDCGSAGRAAATRLHARGADVRVWDPEPSRMAALSESLGVEPWGGGAWEDAEVDLLVPCGPTAVIDQAIAERLAARVVCGLASGVFANGRARDALEARQRRVVPEILAAAAELMALAIAGGWLEREAAVSSIERTATEVLTPPTGAQRRAMTLAIERSKAAQRGC